MTKHQQSIALAGTTSALVNNMIMGVSQGFDKKIELKVLVIGLKLQENY